MYDYVHPEKDSRALSWLRANNSLCPNVPYNLQWEEQARNDDRDFFTGLTGNDSEHMSIPSKVEM